jgi:hypothetical protein
MNLDDIIDRNQDKAPPPEGRAEVCMSPPIPEGGLQVAVPVAHAPELENDPAWQEAFGDPLKPVMDNVARLREIYSRTRQAIGKGKDEGSMGKVPDSEFKVVNEYGAMTPDEMSLFEKSWAELSKSLAEGDAYAMSNFEGFPAKSVDWGKVTPFTNSMPIIGSEFNPKTGRKYEPEALKDAQDIAPKTLKERLKDIGDFTMEGRYEPPTEEVPIVVTVTRPDGTEQNYIAQDAALAPDGKTLTVTFVPYVLESFQPDDLQDGAGDYTQVEIGISDPGEDYAPQSNVGTWSHQINLAQPSERDLENANKLLKPSPQVEAAVKAGVPAGLFEDRPPNPEPMSTQEHATWLEAAERSRRRLEDKLIRPFIEDVIRCFETVDPDDVKPDHEVDGE